MPPCLAQRSHRRGGAWLLARSVRDRRRSFAAACHPCTLPFPRSACASVTTARNLASLTAASISRARVAATDLTRRSHCYAQGEPDPSNHPGFRRPCSNCRDRKITEALEAS
ncbi:hypothetical protein ACFPRL_00725 [Pseudoclavibacter helvolus]